MADVKIRTKEELLLPEYNYYIFFKIDPEEKDIEKIKLIINKEKNKWTQGLPIQRRYRELYADVENVMIKDIGFSYISNGYTIANARALELENAKRFKIGRALKLIRIMSKRGLLLKSELLKIVNSESFKWFTVSDLEREIDPLIGQGILYIDDVIDFKNYNTIECFLPIAQVSSVYELLEIDPSAPFASIAPAIRAAFLKNKSIATTPKGVAIAKIIGIVDFILKTEESKRKYDDFLKVKKYVFDELELRSSLGIHEIDMSEFLDYVQIIKEKLEIYNETAAAYLGAALKEYKIVIATNNMQ